VLSEGECAVPSLIKALEARPTEVLGQVERLREQIAGLPEELSRAEDRLLTVADPELRTVQVLLDQERGIRAFARARGSC
jgi:hypothetical protein